jgi:hypothetical protein
LRFDLCNLVHLLWMLSAVFHLLFQPGSAIDSQDPQNRYSKNHTQKIILTDKGQDMHHPK